MRKRMIVAAFAGMMAAGGSAWAQPDLRVSDVTVNLGGRPFLRPGFGVLSTAKVANVGTQSSLTLEMRLLASTDPVFDLTDTLLGQRAVFRLRPGEMQELSITGFVPDMPSGQYFIGVLFNQPGDLNPADNAAAAPGTTLITCNPDATGDRQVDFADLNIVLSQFGQAGTLNGDTNNDGNVDFADLNAVLSAFGQNCP